MMKNKLLSIIIVGIVVLFILQACNLVYDKDTTSEISSVSVKPEIILLGEPIMSLKLGETYNDEGVKAVAGENEVIVEIESGKVDQNTLGFYVVTYKAANEFGWNSYAYRAVLVHDGSPYETEEIGGNYKIGFF